MALNARRGDDFRHFGDARFRCMGLSNGFLDAARRTGRIERPTRPIRRRRLSTD